MTAPPHIIDALSRMEAVILAALNALTPTNNAHWYVAPPGTAQRMATGGLTRVFVAQHQDGGGAPNPLVNSQGWQGLVAVRCMSRDAAQADSGLSAVALALAGLASPSGFSFITNWVRPIAIPVDNAIYTRAGLWRVSLRRTP
jgi:hypothetical protein